MPSAGATAAVNECVYAATGTLLFPLLVAPNGMTDGSQECDPGCCGVKVTQRNKGAAGEIFLPHTVENSEKFTKLDFGLTQKFTIF
jgi:hypothetical protein